MSQNDNTLIECPRCLGIGEIVIKGNRSIPCPTCAGDGMIKKKIADDFLQNGIFDNY